MCYFKAGFHWWSASLIDYSLNLNQLSSTKILNFKKAFSISNALAGVVGLLASSHCSNYLKRKGHRYADSYLLALGLFGTSVFLLLYLIISTLNPYVTIIFYTILMGFFNFVLLLKSQIILDVTSSKQRATANSLIVFFIHLFGDSNSSYWIGLITDTCLAKNASLKNTYSYLNYCTQLSLYPLVILSFFGACFSLFITFTFDKDKDKTKN